MDEKQIIIIIKKEQTSKTGHKKQSANEIVQRIKKKQRFGD